MEDVIEEVKIMDKLNEATSNGVYSVTKGE